MTSKMISAAALAAAIASSAIAATPPPAGAQSGWAVVQDDGTLVRGKNATGAIHLSTGVYEVDFTTSIAKCSFTGTIGLPGSSGTNSPGFITVAGRGNNADGVFVKTYDQAGASTDLGFHLNVRCKSKNAPTHFAVVNSDGSLARGRDATSASQLDDPGVYQVDFNKNITACGYFLTIGLSGTVGSSDPGTVTVVGRSDDNKGLYIQTFDHKGHPANLGFHVIVQC